MTIRTILIAVLAALAGFLVGRITGPAAQYPKVAEENVILRRDLQLYKYLVEDYEATGAARASGAEPQAEPPAEPAKNP